MSWSKTRPCLLVAMVAFSGSVARGDDAKSLVTTLAKDVIYDQNWSSVYRTVGYIRLLPPQAKAAILDELLTVVESTELLTLGNVADMVVFSRIQDGPVVAGHGWILYQDVYIVGGRAAWVIEQVVGVSLPTVTARTEFAERKQAALTAKLVVEAFKNGMDAAGPGKPTTLPTQVNP